MDKNTLYLFWHLVSVFALTGFSFYAFSSPTPQNKKVISIGSGVFALIALITGFGLLAVYKISFSGWIAVKLICWFGLTALASMVFSKADKAKMFTMIAIVLVFLAIFMVSFKPF